MKLLAKIYAKAFPIDRKKLQAEVRAVSVSDSERERLFLSTLSGFTKLRRAYML